MTHSLLMRIFVVFITYLLLNSCGIKEKENCHSEKNARFSLEIYDSIVVNNYTGSWYITDACEGYLLGFDLKLRDIIIIDIKTSQIIKINKLGDGPGEYTIVKGISFFNDTTFMVMDEKNLHYYSITGQHKITYNLSEFVTMIGWNFKFNIPSYKSGLDTNIILRHYNYNFESGNIDKVNWLTNINLSAKKSAVFVPYQTHNYVYNNKSKSFPDPIPYYTLSSNKDELIIEYPYERFLEIFSIEDFTFTEMIDLCPNNFSREPYSRKSTNQNKLFLNEQINSSFVKLFAVPDAIIAVYKTSIPENKTVTTRPEFIKYDIEKRYRDRYVICVLNNDSISVEIPLRLKDDRFTVIAATSMEKVFLKNLMPLNKDAENVYKLYIGRFRKDK